MYRGIDIEAKATAAKGNIGEGRLIVGAFDPELTSPLSAGIHSPPISISWWWVSLGSAVVWTNFPSMFMFSGVSLFDSPSGDGCWDAALIGDGAGCSGPLVPGNWCTSCVLDWSKNAAEPAAIGGILRNGVFRCHVSRINR